MVESWQNFYSWHNPIALDLGFLQIRWYGLMYVLALLFGYLVGRYFVIKKHINISLEKYDLAFVWIEIGVIVGARIGYVLFYDLNTSWYLTHPWEIFNPFYNGEFVGISGLSYHGALVGFLISAWLFTKKEKIEFLPLMDLSVVAASAGYFFGRIGNFLNNRLIGRETDSVFGIYSDGVLRHPATLYEAFLEGICVFFILMIIKKFQTFSGQLMASYGMLYASARFIAEFFRNPDPQLGYILFNWLTMGQILSMVMFLGSLGIYKYLQGLKK